MQKPDVNHHSSSYRDPSGYVFEKDGTIYRQINQSFKEHFEHFINSGCYLHLVQQGLLISHEIISENYTGSAYFYKTLKPEKIHFISYPYEWSFDMLKDAALLTLRLVKECLKFGVILKDASPYNIQWHHGKYIFIDTLSFEKYIADVPWIAYRQFCECFLSPLLLMHYSNLHLPEMQLAYPNGIPLYMASSLLPWKSRLSFYTYLHIHFHSRIGSRNETREKNKISFSEKKLSYIIQSLEDLISSLKLKERKSTWSGYYQEMANRHDYLVQKQNIIENWLGELADIRCAADLGANEGEFSKLLAAKGIKTIAADFDPYCINRLYNKIKVNGIRNILPLVIDLSNPSPAIGINNKERSSFIERTDADLVLALAVIHHLSIGKNIPFSMIAEFFSRIGSFLLIEFIPKNDEKIQLMLQNKEDIFDAYTAENFLKAFEKYFNILDKVIITGTERILYLMKNHNA